MNKDDKINLILEILTKQDRQHNDILDVKGAADLLSRTPHTIYKWISAKKIPYYPVNGAPYFDRKELISWIHSHRVGTRDEYLTDLKIKSRQQRRPRRQVNTGDK